MKKENSAVKSHFKCSEQADKHFADYEVADNQYLFVVAHVAIGESESAEN